MGSAPGTELLLSAQKLCAVSLVCAENLQLRLSAHLTVGTIMCSETSLGRQPSTAALNTFDGRTNNHHGQACASVRWSDDKDFRFCPRRACIPS
jgi:hypothetical protein